MMFSSIAAEIRMLIIQIMWIVDKAFGNVSTSEDDLGAFHQRAPLHPSATVPNTTTSSTSSSSSGRSRSPAIFGDLPIDNKSYRRASLSSIKQIPRDVFTDIWIASIDTNCY